MADRAPPAGAPAGGSFTNEKYLGQSSIITIIILALIFWPALFGVLCCPCDQREVYLVGGQKYNAQSGALITPGPCGCNC
mmetsp:Transcript_5173/g.11247  ORF Transcript_5173/g.11247 Transcript_5173/m.11247 type:complete len:80 (+) Transcript_5173:71-310(+)